MKRDSTDTADIVVGVVRVPNRIPPPFPGLLSSAYPSTSTAPAGARPTSTCPYRACNLGNHTPTSLLHVIAVLEQALGKKAVENLLPMQPDDILETFADLDDLARDVGFAPSTPIDVGVERFVAWYRGYYRR